MEPPVLWCSFPCGKVPGVWSWPLTSIQCWGFLCIFMAWLSTGFTLPYLDSVKAAKFLSENLKGTGEFGAVGAGGRIFIKCILTFAVDRWTASITVIFPPPTLCGAVSTPWLSFKMIAVCDDKIDNASVVGASLYLIDGANCLYILVQTVGSNF